MRWWLAALLLFPTVGASHASVLDLMHVRALETARWTGADGQEHVGVLGDGTAFFTVEDVATVGHPDLDGCYGEGYLRVAPAPPLEGPNNGFSPLAGHGTWTAAAVCATGEASGGHYRGLAPHAKVLTYVDVLEDPQRAEHQRRMLEAHRPLVLTSSILLPPQDWFDPLDEGADIVVTWAAGNEGGDGDGSRTMDDRNDPRFLVVAAAHWDAKGMATYSSRGDRDDPSTWPHLSAVACHVVPVPYAQPGSITGPAAAVLDQPQSCWVPDPTQQLEMVTGSYRMIDGTSFAAPSTAAVLVLMQQVHPAIRPRDARALVLGTTDLFLPTQDQDGDGAVTREDFWMQHGFEAGRGLLNATAAVAAAHYLALHPDANVTQALACWSVGDEEGHLRLNPARPCLPAVHGTTPPASSPPPSAATNASSPSSAPAAAARQGARGAPALPALGALAAAILLGRRHHR